MSLIVECLSVFFCVCIRGLTRQYADFLDTSKYPSSNSVHGWRGTFLASTAALSLLTVVSRYGRGAECTLTIHNGKVIRRRTSATEDDVSGTAFRGTRVTVNDLFGCMPVRARLRPTPASSAWNRNWDGLLRAMAAHLLAWPSDATLTVEDKSSGVRRLLKTQGPDANLRVVRLLTQTGLCEVANPASWVRVEGCVGSAPRIQISGSVCLKPAASKRAQFLHIGIEPLSETHQAGSLYAEINRIFAESKFGAAAPGKDGIGYQDIRGPIDKFVRELRPAKALDRWPMFCLGIDIDGNVDVDDVLDDRRQYLATLSSLLRTMLYGFLKAHGFYDSISSLCESANDLQTAPPSPTKKPKATDSTASLLTSGKRRRGGQRLLPERSRSTHPPGSLLSSWPRTKSARSLKVKPVEAAACIESASEALQTNKIEETSKFFAETDVISKDGDVEANCHADVHMEDWDGNVFTNGDLKISRASLERAVIIGQVDRKFILVRTSLDDDEAGQSGESNEDTTGPLLLLVDQHAADERCRVESLLEDYFVHSTHTHDTETTALKLANTTVLDRPLQFELADSERPLLERFRAYFQHWGVFYDALPAHDEADADQVTVLRVRRLPRAIADRCRQEPRLVVDLIRREIWTQSASDHAEPYHRSDMSWPALMYGCPRGILDLINSRACRSESTFPGC